LPLSIISMKQLLNQFILKPSLDNHRFLGSAIQKIALAAVIIFLPACATVPHTGRKQLNLVSDAQLNALALKAFNDVAAREPESTNQAIKDVVLRVTQRVSKATETIDKPGFDWNVRVIDKDIPNAFCLPGGKIVVYTGILPYVKNEAGLATVIAHEVAHAVARHGGERLSQNLAIQSALGLGGEILRGKDGTLDQRSRIILGAMGVGGTVGIVLPYSRAHEFEADQIGQVFMAAAGYDPSESVRLWDRMSKINKPPIPVWLSTHPADNDRITKLRGHLANANKYYLETPVKFGLGTPL
jgi:predicted Zn-dependent protease